MGNPMKSWILNVLVVSFLWIMGSGVVQSINAQYAPPKNNVTTGGWNSSSPPPLSLPCFPGLFVFGDSLADTGNSLAIFPDKFALRLKEIEYNQTDSGSSSRRFDDGLLFGDYLALALGLSPMAISPYLQGVHSMYAQGANFAAGGSAVLKDLGVSEILEHHAIFPNLPFTLAQQLEWYQHFKHGAAEEPPTLKDNQTVTLPLVLSTGDFNSSLHVIFAGYTDYVVPLLSGVPKQEVAASVTNVVTGISDFVEVRNYSGYLYWVGQVSRPFREFGRFRSGH
ncbi:hypothetical protein R1flu_017586 [Riccia fluitans]|uniref:GDSL esterase/lipase n=1 Tax=Riccia fluitans TaxID=41844 RepID=A0ABD1ZDN7_9MARC